MLDFCQIMLSFLLELSRLWLSSPLRPTTQPYALQLYNFCFLCFCFYNIWNMCPLAWHTVHFSKCPHMIWTFYHFYWECNCNLRLPSHRVVKIFVLSLGNVNKCFCYININPPKSYIVIYLCTQTFGYEKLRSILLIKHWLERHSVVYTFFMKRKGKQERRKS